MMQADTPPNTYIANTSENPINCPVPGCPASVHGLKGGKSGLCDHFNRLHWRDTLLFDDEAAARTKCPQCGLQVGPRARLAHLNNKQCLEGARRKTRRELDITNSRYREHVFESNNSEIEDLDGFCYLGREIVCNGHDWPAVAKNLQKARRRWAQISRLLARERANSKVSGYFYKAVAQSVLLYGSETWVVTERVLRALSGFHHQVARHLTNRRIHLNIQTQQWVYPSSDCALEEAGLFPMKTYLDRRRNYILGYVLTEETPANELYQATLFPPPGTGGNHHRLYWSTQRGLLPVIHEPPDHN